MFDDARVPYMRTAKASDLLQSLGCKVLHSAASVLLLSAEGNATVLVRTEKARENLIDSQDNVRFTIYNLFTV